jgi:hypothetical protein
MGNSLNGATGTCVFHEAAAGVSAVELRPRPYDNVRQAGDWFKGRICAQCEEQFGAANPRRQRGTSLWWEVKPIAEAPKPKRARASKKRPAKRRRPAAASTTAGTQTAD